MSRSALADYLDARAAIVHEWSGQGLSPADIVDRLSPDPADVRRWLATPPLPLPGSSRALVDELRDRVKALEQAVHAPASAEPERPPPRQSECRELVPVDEGPGWLVLSRRRDERILIDDDVELVVVATHRSSVRLGIRGRGGATPIVVRAERLTPRD